MPTNKTHPMLMTMPALALLVGSCDSDPRLVELAREAAERQAQQSQEIVRVQKEVAEGANNLVTADAEARKELVTVHQQLQEERAVLGQGWNQLEAERQHIAQERLTESRLKPILQGCAATVLVACLFAFCWMLMFGLRHQNDADGALVELLADEVVSDQPRLLPTQPVLPNTEPTLPGPGDGDTRSLPPSN